MRTLFQVTVAVIFLGLSFTAGFADSLRFLPSEPKQFDFADQRALPPAFGAGEFTLELWIKPDSSFPVGFTGRGTFGQLKNWSDFDPRPYSRGDWWYAGNWLLDGHSRPKGFSPADTREGTFSLQFYGGGRLRWMFADDGEKVPVGKVWAVQAYPASETASLLDGRWHSVACVRRWIGNNEAQLELWINGKMVSSEKIPQRVNMRKFWDDPPHPEDPKELGGWSWGSEIMTSWNFFFTQYEDYKGLLDELRFYDRAKSPDELTNNWADPVRENEKGLVGYFPMDEGKGKTLRDRLDSSRIITLHRTARESWSKENAPVISRR